MRGETRGLGIAALVLSACGAAGPVAEPAPPPPALAPARSPSRERHVTWEIRSDPAGAAIWIDGVDTRARTPATLPAPPAGKHTVRLVLAGYADEIVEHWQQPEVGLSLGRIFRAEEVVAREEASRREAERPVDEAAREATRRLLAGDRRKVTVRLQLSASINAPSVDIALRGDGAAEVSWARIPDRMVRVERVRLAADEVQRILDALVEQGFAEVVGRERPGVPDEVRVRLTVSGPAGAAHTAEKWENDAHPRLDPVLRAIAAVPRKLPAELRRETGY